MLIIGLGNKARQGKDLSGTAICEHLQYSTQLEAKIFKIAEAVYEECRVQHGMVGKDAPLLQKVGHDRRKQYINYWLDKTFDLIDETDPDVAIITDVRYKNEADRIKQEGGFLINVSRWKPDGTRFIADDRPADHISEVDLDQYPWDFYLRVDDGDPALVGYLAKATIDYIFDYRLGVHV